MYHTVMGSAQVLHTETYFRSKK